MRRKPLILAIANSWNTMAESFLLPVASVIEECLMRAMHVGSTMTKLDPTLHFAEKVSIATFEGAERVVNTLPDAATPRTPKQLSRFIARAFKRDRCVEIRITYRLPISSSAYADRGIETVDVVVRHQYIEG